MNGIIYYTKIRDEYSGKNMEHMIGEKLLEIGLEREYGRKLAFEPRAKGEHGKPFFTLLPKIHYNISHSGKYVMCLFAGEEVGIDIQIHKKVNYERILERLVPADMVREILGEGLSRDLRTIPMDKGNYMMLEMEPGYSGAVWSKDDLELRFEYEDIILR